MGAFDMDQVRLPLTMRYSKMEENFVEIGGFREALTGKELILEDSEKAITIYPHRDSDFTKITFRTQKILLIIAGVSGVNREEITSATEKTCDYIARFAGGEYDKWIQSEQT
jgi:DNA/RNA-binding domain of Phe-tRNA-synthetase-like protein